MKTHNVLDDDKVDDKVKNIEIIKDILLNKPIEEELTTFLDKGEKILNDDMPNLAIDIFIKVFRTAYQKNDYLNISLSTLRLGDAYLKQPGGTVIATLHYEQAAELDSLQADLQHKLAKAYYVQRRYNAAARAYRKAVQLNTTNHAALFELAKLYYDAEQYANAAAYLQTYVWRNPSSREAWPMYLEALYLSKQYDEVLAVAPRVLQFEPGSSNALKMVAHAQFEQREYDQAIATYQQLGEKEALPVDDASIDVVISNGVINLCPDKMAVMQEVHRVLKPGGRFVTFAYVHGVWLPPGKRFADLLPEYFSTVSKSPVVWLNVPPAFVYRCRR